WSTGRPSLGSEGSFRESDGPEGRGEAESSVGFTNPGRSGRKLERPVEPSWLSLSRLPAFLSKDEPRKSLSIARRQSTSGSWPSESEGLKRINDGHATMALCRPFMRIPNQAFLMDRRQDAHSRIDGSSRGETVQRSRRCIPSPLRNGLP